MSDQNPANPASLINMSVSPNVSWKDRAIDAGISLATATGGTVAGTLIAKKLIGDVDSHVAGLLGESTTSAFADEVTSSMFGESTTSMFGD